LDIRKNLFPEKVVRHWTQEGFKNPGAVQKPCGCGPWGHGLAGMGVLG